MNYVDLAAIISQEKRFHYTNNALIIQQSSPFIHHSHLWKNI